MTIKTIEIAMLKAAWIICYPVQQTRSGNIASLGVPVSSPTQYNIDVKDSKKFQQINLT